MKKTVFYSILTLFLLAELSAQRSLTVTGSDTSEMLLNGNVHIYVSLSQEDPEALGSYGAENFSLEEYNPTEQIWSETPVKEFQYNGFAQEDISVMLMIDNSGSMYDSIGGRPETDPDRQRIHYLTSALNSLFTKTSGFRDNLSLLTFNTYITQESGFTSDRRTLKSALDNINRPDRDEAFTELYRAMEAGSDKLSLRKGRKVLILLTDGENYTYSENREEPHPVWGNQLLSPEEIEEKFLKRGMTLYTIFYARNTDPRLESLSRQTGGGTYTASSRDELIDAYLEIHEKINREFRLTYSPDVSPWREKVIRVTLDDGTVTPEFGFHWEIFWGLPPGQAWWFYLILTVLSVGIIIVIHFTPFEKLYPFPHLEVLSPDSENDTILEISGDRTLLAVTREKTEIIPDRDYAPGSDETGVTIIRDEKNNYMLSSDKEIMVNNQPVKTKLLEPGDVIRAEGTLIVFDEPEEDK